MFIEVQYQDLITNYSNEINNAIAKFRKGKSKIKDIEPEKLTWGFNWCVSINADPGFNNLSDLFAKPKEYLNLQKSKNNQSIDDKVIDYGIRCSVGIIAKLKNRTLIQTECLNHTPQIILDNYRKTLIEEEKEQKRFNSLSVKEKNKEVQDAIKQLQSLGGFSMFKL